MIWYHSLSVSAGTNEREVCAIQYAYMNFVHPDSLVLSNSFGQNRELEPAASTQLIIP